MENGHVMRISNFQSFENLKAFLIIHNLKNDQRTYKTEWLFLIIKIIIKRKILPCVQIRLLNSVYEYDFLL